jgi:hypothetical protein
LPNPTETLHRAASEGDMNGAAASRRERNWLLSFVMAPFQDLDKRAVELNATRQRHDR